MTELNPTSWPRISHRPIFRWGVVGNPLHIENRRTMIANQLAVFFVLLSVPTVLLEVLQYPDFAVAQVVFLGFWSLMGSVLLLNRSGRPRTARFVFLSTILFYFYVTNLMWPPLDLEFKGPPCFFQLGVLACALVLYDLRRDRWLMLGLILTVFLQVTFFYELDKMIDFFNIP